MQAIQHTQQLNQRQSNIALTVLTALSLVTALGCGPTSDVESEEASLEVVQAAVPSSEALSIRFPGAEISENDGEVGQAKQALIGQTAELYLITRNISWTVNGAAHAWLSLVDDIVHNPPSANYGSTLVWGPHTPTLSPVTYLFVLTADPSQGVVHYTLEGKVKNQPNESYLPLITGQSTPGPNHPVSGSMAIDFDNAQALDPTKVESGDIVFFYGDAGTHWGLDVLFDEFVGQDAQGPRDAMYRYREAADQSGDFGFVTKGNVDQNPALEIWHIRSRWLAGGSGRSEVEMGGGDLGSLVVSATECWNEMFQRTYWSVDPAFLDPPEGQEQSCLLPAFDVQ